MLGSPRRANNEPPLHRYRVIIACGGILFFLMFFNTIYFLSLPPIDPAISHPSHDKPVRVDTFQGVHSTHAPHGEISNHINPPQLQGRTKPPRSIQNTIAQSDAIFQNNGKGSYPAAYAHAPVFPNLPSIPEGQSKFALSDIYPPDPLHPPRTEFPNFADFLPPNYKSTGRHLRIVFPTYALMGPIKNGGIATAHTALATALVEAGHKVTILYLHGRGVQIKSMTYWIKHYREKGITVVPLPKSDITLSPSLPTKWITKCYQAYLWLLKHQDEFDIMHFHEWHGPGYFTALAKRQGLAFHRTLLFTTIHCPALFYLSGNYNLLTSMNNLGSDFLERELVRMSDVVVSPSRYMLGWIQSHGWTLPSNVLVQQNIMSKGIISYLEVMNEEEPRTKENGPTASSELISVVEPNQLKKNDLKERGKVPSKSTIDIDIKYLDYPEIIFFGRIEVLKGIYEFCDAMDILAREVSALELGFFNVTFLGNPNMGSLNAVDYLNRRAKKWPMHMKVLSNKIQPEAIAYMKGAEGRVAVLASKLENSPYTVLECIALEIPFIASTVGGIPELIHPEDRDKVLFNVNAKDLADRVRDIVRNGAPLARGVADPLKIKTEWVEFNDYIFQQWEASLPSFLKDKNLNTFQLQATKAANSLTNQSKYTEDTDMNSVSSQAIAITPPSSFPPAFVWEHITPLPPAHALPSVTVIIPHHDRGKLLIDTLNSLLHQDYAGKYDIMLVDDGSTDLEARTVIHMIESILFDARQKRIDIRTTGSKRFSSISTEYPTRNSNDLTAIDEWLEFDGADFINSSGHVVKLGGRKNDLLTMKIDLLTSLSNIIDEDLRKWAKESINFRLLKQDNLYPGAARNNGVRHSTTDYVLFLDDDDLLRPDWMSTLVSVGIRTSADVVTTMADFFKGDDVPINGVKPMMRWITVGPAADLGMFRNVYGAYCALVKRESFFNIGGFTTEKGSTFEDYEFFATAVLKGFKLTCVPEPLLLYRQNPKTHLMSSTNKYTNRMRALRPYLAAVPPQLRNAIMMGYGNSRNKKK